MAESSCGPDMTCLPEEPPQVEFCTRVADLPVVDLLGLEHWWLRTPNVEAGMGPDDGGVPGDGGSDSPYVSQTQINDHTGRGDLPGSTCTPVDEMKDRWSNMDQACVEARLEIGRDTGTWSLFNQCHTVVADILEECARPVHPSDAEDDPSNPDPAYRYSGGPPD